MGVHPPPVHPVIPEVHCSREGCCISTSFSFSNNFINNNNEMKRKERMGENSHTHSKKKKLKNHSGDCTTVATQPRQLHYSNNLSNKTH